MNNGFEKLSYLSNPNVKRDGVTEKLTKEQVLEYANCATDPSYFIEKYVKIISLDEGLVNFKLYDYQKKLINAYAENRFVVTLSSRQSGKSITSCAFLLWYVLFKPEQTVAILANKGATSREMLARITLMLENIPFFLQPGCKALNKGSIEFSNNSSIFAAATSGSSIRGRSCNLLYLDEFAFVENDEEFYTSTYPVVTAGKKTKVIITSTANGMNNTFYRIWSTAKKGKNNYIPIEVKWSDVPGRDEQWKEETIANTSELQFMQEFENNFLFNSNTLIDSNTLLSLSAEKEKEIRDTGSTKIYEYPIEGHDYIMCVDVAKGRGQDYSTFNIIDVSVKPFQQVAVYRNNNISPLLFPDVIIRYAKKYNDAIVVIETNDQGIIVANGVYYDHEYENMYTSSFKVGDLGVSMDKKVKRIGCSNLKDMMENGLITINDFDTIAEFSSFVSRGSSFEADAGCHDDLVMNFVMFGFFMSTNYFVDATDINIKEMIQKQREELAEEDIAPFGFVEGGFKDSFRDSINIGNSNIEIDEDNSWLV